MSRVLFLGDKRMVRFQILLTNDEVAALNLLAEKNMRDLRCQIRFMVRQELLQCHLLHEEAETWVADSEFEGVDNE